MARSRDIMLPQTLIDTLLLLPSYHPSYDISIRRLRQNLMQPRGEVIAGLLVFGQFPASLDVAGEITIGVVNVFEGTVHVAGCCGYFVESGRVGR